jgi:hypothetical protein
MLIFVFTKGKVPPMPRRILARLPALLAASAVLLAAAPAAAFDPFEIQVYDGSANEPGVASLELHWNYAHAPHRAVEAPEISWHKQAHFTFEPALGITRFWEIGAYLQWSARIDDSLYWAGIKLRSKFVTPEGLLPGGLLLGLNIEVSAIPEKFEADRFGGELRPILGWETKWLQLAVNPNVEVSFAGAGLHEGPSFAPGVALCFKVPEIVSMGVEYYGSIGPIAHPLRAREQEHYLFGVVNVLAAAGWEINAGVGAGLTPASNDVVVKVILGHEIGRLWGHEAKAALAPQARRTPPPM